ncbi:MAG: hypothetical protein ABIR33_12620 [Pyrinomonadaceae bacterium]
MTSGPISLSRRHVLGDLYSRCDVITSVPVYLNSVDGEMLGHVDQGLGHYADAFSFHLADDVCKKLSAGFFTYAFDYRYSDEATVEGQRKKVVLTAIFLIARQNYERPVARSTRAVG